MLADCVILIRPRGFDSNPETAGSNAFQVQGSPAGLQEKVLVEHRRLEAALVNAGIEVIVLEPHRADLPDAVFPNNWFSTHPDGTVLIYPMEVASRRREIRPDFGEELKARGFSVNNLRSIHTPRRVALEGTGSLVLDPANDNVFACRSSRTDEGLAKQWAEVCKRELLIFDAADGSGQAIYHTNVIMGVGESLAIACLECISGDPDREKIRRALVKGQRELIDISIEQVRNFAGNVLFLDGRDGETMFISQRGWTSLTDEQRTRISSIVHPVPVAIDTIESAGGGSVRCMIAENFLPHAN